MKRISAWSSQADGSAYGVHFLTERCARGLCSRARSGQLAFYLHVDDGLVVRTRREKKIVDGAKHVSADALEGLGLVVSDREDSDELVKTLGCDIDQGQGVLALPRDKAQQIRSALRFVASRSAVSISALATLLGIWIWDALLKRNLLSIPRDVFKMIERGQGGIVSWWRVARQAVCTMAEAVTRMRSELNRPTAPVVFAPDARGPERGDESAFGIVAADTAREMFERCAEEGLTPGHPVTRLGGDYTGTRRASEPWRARKPLSRLPSELLGRPQRGWADVDWGKWRFPDHISLGQTRTVVRLARRQASGRGTRHHRILSLQDNGACAGVVMKGRSPQPSLNHLAMQRASHCLAGGLTMLLPRVETYFQPADALSRTA